METHICFPGVIMHIPPAGQGHIQYLRLDYGSNFTLTLHLMTTLRVKFTCDSSCQCESCHSPWTMYKKAKQKGGKNVNKEVVTIVWWILLIKQNKYTSKRDMQRWINMQSTHAVCSCLQTVFVCALLSIWNVCCCIYVLLCWFLGSNVFLTHSLFYKTMRPYLQNIKDLF